MVEIRCPICRGFVMEIQGESPTTPPIRTHCYSGSHVVTVELRDGKIAQLSAALRVKKAEQNPA